MATVSAHLPDNSKLLSDFSAHVEKHFGGKPGPFIKKLIELFFEKQQATPEATGENILVELCQRLRPTSAEMLGEWLASQGLNQPHLLGKLLDALADSLMRDINNKVSYGDAPLVLIKLLREDACAVQAAYAFRQLPSTGEALAKLFDHKASKATAIEAMVGAVSRKQP